MAATAQTPFTTALTGTTVTLTAPGLGAGNGDLVPSGCFLLVKNANASPMTVTVKASGTTLDGTTLADKTYTVAATTNSLIGPFAADMRQTAVGASLGLVSVEFSSITSLTRCYVASPW